MLQIFKCNPEWLTDNSTELLRSVHTKPFLCQVDQIWYRNGPLLFTRDRVFSWAVCLHGTFLLLSAFRGSDGNKNRSSTTSDCLHVQKGRVLNRSPAYLYKTVYTLLLLSFFSFWDQHPKNVVDLYRRVDKRLHIKKRKQKCGTEPIVSGLKVPFTRGKRNVTSRTKNDTWPFESTLLSPTQPFLSRRATLLLKKWLLTFELLGALRDETKTAAKLRRQVWMLPVSFLKKSIAGHILSSKIGSVRAVFFSFLSNV